MDIMNAIYNCCDGLLLKTLMEKLNLCRLNIPIIFPDINDGNCTLLSWSLRGIVPVWKYKNKCQTNSNLVDSQQSFISFFRSGRLPISKSKLLNELLNSTHHDTFFHRECEFGMSTRIVSNGTIEASWYLPSNYEETGYRQMFTCLNLRGDALDCLSQTQWLCKYSDLIFILLDMECVRTGKYSRIIENTEEVQPDVVLCIMPDLLGTVGTCKMHLNACTEYFQKISKHFVLCQTWTDSRLLTASEIRNNIRDIIKNFTCTRCFEKTIGKIVSGTEHTNIFRNILSDERCNPIEVSRSSAEEIMKSICEIDPVNQKLRLFPLQGRLWKKWCKLKKEQFRIDAPEELIESFVTSKEEEMNEIRKEQFKIFEQMRNESPIIRLAENMSGTQYNGNTTLLYYLTWVEILMNDIKRVVVAEVVDKHHAELKLRRHHVNSVIENEAHELVEQELWDYSFELDHIFREFSQMYECTSFHKINSVSVPDGTGDILNLPNVVARLMLQGWPFELMDGSVELLFHWIG